MAVVELANPGPQPSQCLISSKVRHVPGADGKVCVMRPFVVREAARDKSCDEVVQFREGQHLSLIADAEANPQAPGATTPRTRAASECESVRLRLP